METSAIAPEMIEIVIEEFRVWLEQYPERVEDAHNALIALEESACRTLSREQLGALTTITNLVGKAVGRD